MDSSRLALSLRRSALRQAAPSQPSYDEAGPPPRAIIEIDIGELLPAAVADHKAGVLLLDEPGRREATRRHRARCQVTALTR